MIHPYTRASTFSLAPAIALALVCGCGSSTDEPLALADASPDALSEADAHWQPEVGFDAFASDAAADEAAANDAAANDVATDDAAANDAVPDAPDDIASDPAVDPSVDPTQDSAQESSADATDSEAEAQVLGPCDPIPGSPDHAIVVSYIGDNVDGVRVYTLGSGGTIIDHGLDFGGFSLPRYVAIRPDGREAIVVYGAYATDYGIVVLSIEPDGSAAQVKQNLVIGSAKVTYGAAYASQDHAVIGVASGPTGHQLVALDRDSNGNLAVGQVALIPGDWPLELRGRPGTDQALLLRCDLSADAASEIRPIGLGPSGWTSIGTSGMVAPPSIQFAVHPNGLRVYSPSYDPNDPGTPSDPVPAGKLHSMHYDTTNLQADPAFDLPKAANTIAVAPDGSFLVVDEPVWDSGANSTRSYRLQTVTLDAQGTPTGVVVSQSDIPALLLHGFDISGSGLLVTAIELYPDQAPTPGQVYPMKAWKQKQPGQWTAECNTIDVPGLPAMAIAP